MSVARIKDIPYPEDLHGVPEIKEYLKRLYTALQEEQSEKIEDFDVLKMDNVGWEDVRAYANNTNKQDGLANAISKIGSTETTLLIPNQQDVTANATVPANVTLWFLRGGSINVGAFDLDINGRIINPDNHYILIKNSTGTWAINRIQQQNMNILWTGAAGYEIDSTAAAQITAGASSATVVDSTGFSPGMGFRIYGAGVATVPFVGRITTVVGNVVSFTGTTSTTVAIGTAVHNEDSYAIQDIIDGANYSTAVHPHLARMTIDVPSGQYFISKTVIINNNQFTIRGEGTTASNFYAFGSDDVFDFDQVTNVVTNVDIENLTVNIAGAYTISAFGTVAGIADSLDDINFRNVWIQGNNANSTGISGQLSFYFNRLTIEGIGKGIDVLGSRIYGDTLHLWNLSGNCITMDELVNNGLTYVPELSISNVRVEIYSTLLSTKSVFELANMGAVNIANFHGKVNPSVTTSWRYYYVARFIDSKNINITNLSSVDFLRKGSTAQGLYFENCENVFGRNITIEADLVLDARPSYGVYIRNCKQVDIVANIIGVEIAGFELVTTGAGVNSYITLGGVVTEALASAVRFVGATQTQVDGIDLSGLKLYDNDTGVSGALPVVYNTSAYTTVNATALPIDCPSIIDSSGGGLALTLADGQHVGQQKYISMVTAGNNADVTIAHHETNDNEVARFDAADEYLLLVWTGTEWATVNSSCTFP